MFFQEYNSWNEYILQMSHAEAIIFSVISLLLVIIFFVRLKQKRHYHESLFTSHTSELVEDKDVLMQDKPLGPKGQALNSKLPFVHFKIPKVIEWFVLTLIFLWLIFAIMIISGQA